jgi:hypothetical protein
MSDRSGAVFRNIRLCLTDHFNRIERLEETVGIGPKAMHRRVAALEERLGGQTPVARYARPDHLPHHFEGRAEHEAPRIAGRQPRVWIGGGASGKVHGNGYTLPEAEARAAALKAETRAAHAAQAASKAAGARPLRLVG